ncbi:hypothetical protein SRABI36_02354 [Pedobacter sp. Bi36]|nr:hypothetical protein SRABI126_00327 [Pedobacter sp. Bi126]CAH0215923.1 hypothetical protein SRABI36_02354 [Pedobacter sp. Bi36]
MTIALVIRAKKQIQANNKVLRDRTLFSISKADSRNSQPIDPEP